MLRPGGLALGGPPPQLRRGVSPNPGDEVFDWTAQPEPGGELPALTRLDVQSRNRNQIAGLPREAVALTMYGHNKSRVFGVVLNLLT